MSNDLPQTLSSLRKADCQRNSGSQVLGAQKSPAAGQVLEQGPDIPKLFSPMSSYLPLKDHIHEEDTSQ